MNVTNYSRRSLLALVSVAFFAGTAWAGAPSITTDMPPEIKSWREEILTREEYQILAEEWRAYLDQHPESAVAYVQIARSLRYAGTASAEERQKLIQRAYELDSSCPEALDALGCTGLHREYRMVGSLEEAYDYSLRAVELAPDWPDPHFTLWSLAVVLGRYQEAQGHLQALIEKNAIASPLLDFNYNMLVSAEEEAIIFTNGDNDTYPALALQATYGIRTDVAIVNLSLLNVLEYALWVWRDVFGDSGPLTKRDLQELHDTFKREYKATKKLLATRVVAALLEKVHDGRWRKPVYFAVTVTPSRLEESEQSLEIEGLLWRVKRESRRDSGEEECEVNLARTLRLFQNEFRLDSATDFGFPWSQVSALRPLMTNYPAVLRLVATESAKQGDIETVRYALREGIRILEFHEKEETAHQMGHYWRELDPYNPETDRWK